jgi:uncharacterized integral membrane protein
MRFLKIIVFTAIVILAIVFIIQNLQMFQNTLKVRINLYFLRAESPDMPVWVIILFTFFLGVFTASLYGIYEIIVQRRTIRRLRHNMDIMARELKQATATAELSAASANLEDTSRDL